jgi:Tfp pilus assembly protein PilF
VNTKPDFKKFVVKEGEGSDYDAPKEDGKAKISYVVRLNDKHGQVVMQGDDVEFLVDDDETFPEGFHTAVKDTQKGSTVEFSIAPHYMWGDDGNAKLGVPPNCKIHLLLTVSDFTNPKDNWELEPAEKWAEAKRQKEDGNVWFKAGQLSRAAKRYQKAHDMMENFTKDDRKEADVEAEEMSAFKLNVLNNLALVNFKMQNYEEAVEKASEAIKLDEKNVKALTRRGQAQMANGNLDEAKEDFKRALECEPDEQEKRYIMQQMKIVKGKLKEYKSKQRKIYSGMFK